MDEQYRATEEDYRRLFRQVGCGVFISSRDGRYLDVNPALIRMLGYGGRAEVLSLDIGSELYRQAGDRERFQEKIRKEGQVVDYEVDLKKKDGTSFKALVTCTPRHDAAGKTLGYEGIVVDLDERLKTERELRRTQQRLLQSEKLAAMGRLTSQLAHELNNPLFGILNTMELVRKEIPSGHARRRLLDMSIAEVMKMAELLKRMLAFSKPDSGKTDRLDINPMIEETLSLHEKQFQANNIQARFCPSDAPASLCAATSQIRQVVLNLIANAIEAMPAGGTLTIATHTEKDLVRIVAEDSGCGIEKGDLGKIFDAFFTTKRETVQDVGLGLFICHGIVSDLNGRIEVESSPGKGATFTIQLPAGEVG